MRVYMHCIARFASPGELVTYHLLWRRFLGVKMKLSVMVAKENMALMLVVPVSYVQLYWCGALAVMSGCNGF